MHMHIYVLCATCTTCKHVIVCDDDDDDDDDEDDEVVSGTI